MSKRILRKVLSAVTACSMILTGCAGSSDSSSSKKEIRSSNNDTVSESIQSSPEFTIKDVESLEFKTNPEDLDFNSLNDDGLSRYMDDLIYEDLVTKLDSEDYFVENVDSLYLSKEYIEEVEYNSKKNVYFGYTLDELEQQFQGKKYIFTLGEDGSTVVEEFKEYENIFAKIMKDVMIGTGVILFCVTVSVVSAGAGAPAISMIFAASAKTGTTMALSGGMIGAAANGIVTGIQTGNMEEALKAAALGGAEGFKLGAISGAIMGGAGEAIALHGATANGLTMNQAAIIQKESKYPLDVIKQFNSMEQYNICKEAGLTSKMVNGKTALIRNIDLNYVDEATGLTNLERMKQGLAALDPSGKAYELHHIGQHADSTLAILTQEEHRLGDSYKIWHELVGKSEIDRVAFDKTREAFWENIAKIMG